MAFLKRFLFHRMDRITKLVVRVCCLVVLGLIAMKLVAHFGRSHQPTPGVYPEVVIHEKRPSNVMLNNADKTLGNVAAKTSEHQPMCVKYDLNKDASSFAFPCLPMRDHPKVNVCLYPKNANIAVSKRHWENSTWETEGLNNAIKWLIETPDAGFIDIGANIGTYSMLVATEMKRPVLAVEPNWENAFRFHKAAKLNDIAHKMTLLVNGVSDKRGVAKVTYAAEGLQSATLLEKVKLKPGQAYNESNKYTRYIHADDLVPYCNFNKAIMKVDVGGMEQLVFRHAHRLFNSVDILYIHLSFGTMMRAVNIQKTAQDDKSKMYELFLRMIDFFQQRGYRPKTLTSELPLSYSDVYQWPDDIMLVKS